MSSGTKVSSPVPVTLSFTLSLEIRKGKATPAPASYNQETSKAAKPARFDNIHLGTDKKITQKDIKLTPGPGHYIRVDE